MLRHAHVLETGVWPRHRCIISSRGLEPGAVVCEAAAHAVVVTEECKRRACAACFKLSEGRLTVKCSECSEVYFCDEYCMQEHAAVHAAACPALQRFTSLKRVGKEMMAVLRLLLAVMAKEHHDDTPDTTRRPLSVVDIGAGARRSCHAEHAGPSSADLGDADAADVDTAIVGGDSSGAGDGGSDGDGDGGDACAHRMTFGALQHHPPVFDSLKEAHDWSKCAALFRAVVETCPWCPWLTPASLQAPPTDDELFGLVSRIDSNVFGVFGREVGDGPTRIANGRNVDLIGHGVYLGASLFNHSCTPNCFVSSGVHSLCVTVDSAVGADEELTIAYCDVQLPLAARRRQLSRHYRFECSCERCEAEASGVSKPKLSYSGGGGGPPKGGLTKREKRERREQREEAKVRSGAASSGGHPQGALGCAGDGGAGVEAGGRGGGVLVAVDLRVLLKLQKAHATTTTGYTSQPARRKKRSGGPPAAPVAVPTCCVGLRLVRWTSPARSGSRHEERHEERASLDRAAAP